MEEFNMFGLQWPKGTNGMSMLSYLLVRDSWHEDYPKNGVNAEREVTRLSFDECCNVDKEDDGDVNSLKGWDEVVELCESRGGVAPSRLWVLYVFAEAAIDEYDKLVVRSPWLDDMLEAILSNEFVSLAGCASSGKSYAVGFYAVMFFIASPTDTLMFVTSTSIKGAQLRVWKTISSIWNAIPFAGDYGELVHSKCMIRGFEKGKPADHLGIHIVAAGSGSEQAAEDRLIGSKADRLYLFADELPQLPKQVIIAASTNLVNGSEEQPFKMVAMGNPFLMTDAFGEMSKPVDGWDSVSEGVYEWKTDRGVVKRYDSERSPNFINGKETLRYGWLPKSKIIALAKKQYGEKSLPFYRQYKAFWFREASTETVYSEGDIVMGLGLETWDLERDGEIMKETKIAGADPSYTQGGDVFPFVYGRVIETNKGHTLVQVDGVINLDDMGTEENKDTPRTYRSVTQLQELCSKHNISPDNFGYDGTGAGVTFADVITSEWSGLPLNIQFGGNASALPAGINDSRPASEVYSNRVTELWVRGKGMFAEKMIRGLPQACLEQMVVRRWNTATRSGAKKIGVERKLDMKAREGRSPDEADAFFVMLEVAIQRGLIPQMANKRVIARTLPNWKKMAQFHNINEASDMWLE
jgi:hypothetical protein